jgi:hypothetical protein
MEIGAYYSTPTVECFLVERFPVEEEKLLDGAPPAGWPGPLGMLNPLSSSCRQEFQLSGSK